MGRGNSPLSNQVKARVAEEAHAVYADSDDAVPSSIDPDSLIPSGSTLLDLALSGHTAGGWQKGRIDLLIGDSDSGKTMLALTMFAECALQRRFDGYRFILDAVETNSNIDIPGLLGRRVAQRIEPPAEADGEPVYSNTIQDYHDNVMRAIEDGRPFLYVMDSVDALSSEEEQDKLEEAREAREKGKEVSGSFGGEKPKVAGQLLRNIKGHLRKTQSHLLNIFQTRDNIGAMPGQSTRRYSGGRAWKFYAQHEVWLHYLGQLKNDKTKMRTGIQAEARVEKNHLTGRKREAKFNIYYDYGVDDLGSMVDFLKAQNIFGKAGSHLVVDNWGLDGKFYRDDLIKAIEEKGLERRVRREVGRVWTELENSIKLGRKPRFG